MCWMSIAIIGDITRNIFILNTINKWFLDFNSAGTLQGNSLFGEHIVQALILTFKRSIS